MECRHCNLSLYFVVKNLQKPSFYRISCLLSAYFRCQRTCVLNPQLVFALEFYNKKVPPRGVEGLWMGFPHPLYSSHCCHTFSNARRASHDHLNDRKSRPSLNMTIFNSVPVKCKCPPFFKNYLATVEQISKAITGLV